MTRHLTLVAHAPEISELADSDEVPAWDGRAGDDVGPISHVPSTPSFGAIATASKSGSSYPGAIYAPVIASLIGGIPPASFQIDHRLSGAGAWTTVSIQAGAGGAMIEVYQIGDAVDLRVRALDNSTPVNASAYSLTTTIIVGAQDARSLDFSKKLNSDQLMDGW